MSDFKTKLQFKKTFMAKVREMILRVMAKENQTREATVPFIVNNYVPSVSKRATVGSYRLRLFSTKQKGVNKWAVRK